MAGGGGSSEFWVERGQAGGRKGELRERRGGGDRGTGGGTSGKSRGQGGEAGHLLALLQGTRGWGWALPCCRGRRRAAGVWRERSGRRRRGGRARGAHHSPAGPAVVAPGQDSEVGLHHRRQQQCRASSGALAGAQCVGHSATALYPIDQWRPTPAANAWEVNPGTPLCARAAPQRILALREGTGACRGLQGHARSRADLRTALPRSQAPTPGGGGARQTRVQPRQAPLHLLALPPREQPHGSCSCHGYSWQQGEVKELETELVANFVD